MFDWKLSSKSKGVTVEADLFFYDDDIAEFAGISVLEWQRLRRGKRVEIAARWLAKRQLKNVQMTVELDG